MSDSPYPAAFVPFAGQLEERFTNGIYTNEDSVRYLFFSALLTHAGLSPNEIILEFPHPSFGRKKVDTYIPPANGREGMVAEFKYDRNVSREKNKARTRQAGQIFADIGRLARFDITNEMVCKYLIYVTDREMLKYFQNVQNGLEWFIDVEMGREIPVDTKRLSGLSETFRKNAGEINDGTSIILVYGVDLPNHALRIYKVAPGSQ